MSTYLYVNKKVIERKNELRAVAEKFFNEYKKGNYKEIEKMMDKTDYPTFIYSMGILELNSYTVFDLKSYTNSNDSDVKLIGVSAKKLSKSYNNIMILYSNEYGCKYSLYITVNSDNKIVGISDGHGSDFSKRFK